MFGVFAIVLNTMQVSLAVQQTPIQGSWEVFYGICRVFSELTLGVMLMVVVYLLASFGVRAVGEVVFALKAKWRRGLDVTAEK